MRNVFIVGPSCSGKTSLFHFLREQAGDVANFPIRVVSRPQRPVSDAFENIFLTHEEFRTKRKSNEFFLSWERQFGEGRTEYYAFRRKDVSDGKINIFSGNLLVYSDTILPNDIFQKHETYFIACMAPESLRAARLKERSPEYDEEEVRIRIYEESTEKHLKGVDLIIDTEHGTIAENGQKALEFIRALA